MKLDIAYIGLRGVPAVYSGVERAVEEIGGRLAKMGHRITIYCMSQRYKEKFNKYRGMELRYIPTIMSKNYEMMLYCFIATTKSLFSNHDIIHYHAQGPSTAAFIPRIMNLKVVATVHSLEWKRAKWGRTAKKYLKYGEWASANYPHKTIVVSETLKKYYEEKYLKRVHYIPNGMKIAKKINLNYIKKKFNLKRNKYILFVGRLVQEKKIELLINAYKEINTDIKLVVVGGTSFTDSYIKKLRDLAISDHRIIFTGPIYGKHLDELFSNAYLFVLPSALEGNPIVILEALSFGNAVLVSDIKENIEVITENQNLYGFTFVNENQNDLEHKLEKLMENSKLVDEMKTKAKQFAFDKYNWDNIAEKTLELYRRFY